MTRPTLGGLKLTYRQTNAIARMLVGLPVGRAERREIKAEAERLAKAAQNYPKGQT
jgi:hypothetical protein